jgi:branched-chain amino acid transport system ATP-binding protein
VLVTLIGDIKRSGVSIIWIEHVVHALVASIDRLLVLYNGAFIAEGDPHAVIRSDVVSEIYMGIETDVV